MQKFNDIIDLMNYLDEYGECIYITESHKPVTMKSGVVYQKPVLEMINLLNDGRLLKLIPHKKL